MREAFCALVVHRTLRWLHFSWDDYFDAIRKIWVKKIGDLELFGASGLLSTDLARWRNDIEAALWDREIAKRLLRIETTYEARRLVRFYLEETFSRLPGDTIVDDVAYAPAPTEGTIGSSSLSSFDFIPKA
ncbi:hypothetical protein F3Y22_tig00110186pilonHSYRG00119 [Hibiscus syriacus]|uniref:Uncharacterized protein n=1 Tax=Hibiscus syriacus TaxID=106335 RepID=A0A6A3BDQ3_HIBSY|nr:hypothetical protein F3Y22_tig00110186pilonHSYRG00119 [Hibiscus syriacus]